MAPYIQELNRLSPLVGNLQHEVNHLNNRVSHLHENKGNLDHTVEELVNTVRELKLQIEEIEKASKPYEIVEVDRRRGRRHGLHRRWGAAHVPEKDSA